jgi:hypothetical protein
MSVARIIIALIVFLATLSSAFAGTFHWHGYGPGLTGGYNVVSISNERESYGFVTTPNSVNGGYRTCNNGRCSSAAIGMGRQTTGISENGERTYGDWQVTDVRVRNPNMQTHIYRDTRGTYSGSIHGGNAGWTYYTPRGYYYPPYVEQPSVYAYPDLYGSSIR